MTQSNTRGSAAMAPAKRRKVAGKGGRKATRPVARETGGDVTRETDNASKDTPITPSDSNGDSAPADVETDRSRQNSGDGGRGGLTGETTGRSPGSASSDGAPYASEVTDEGQEQYTDRDRFS